MSSPVVAIDPIFLVQPDKIDEAASMFSELQYHSRADDGCIQYDFYTDLDDPCRFILHEQWRDSLALADHNTLEHVVTFVAAITPLLSAPFTVMRLSPLL